MSTPVVPPAPTSAASVDPELARAHRFGVWSLLMLVFLIPAAIVSAIASLVILGSADLEGSEPMSVQGTPGWVALILGWLLFMTPMALGVAFGARARAGGERLGTIGMIVDGVILVGYTLLLFGNTLQQ